MITTLFSWFKKQPENALETTWAQNQNAHNTAKKKWDAAQVASGFKTCDLQLAYKSESGSVWYVYADLFKVSRERYMQMHNALLGLKHGFSPADLPEFLNSIIAQANNPVKVRQLAEDARNRAVQLPELQVLMQVGLPLFLRHDENPYTFSNTLQIDKLAEFEKDNLLRAFFLNFAWELTREVSADLWERYKINSAQDFQTLLLQKRAEQAIKSEVTTKQP